MYNTPVLAFVRARDIERLLGHELPVPRADLARAVAEYDRQHAIYAADVGVKEFARRVSGGGNA